MMKRTMMILLLMLAMCLGICMPAGAEAYDHVSHPGDGSYCLVCDVASMLLDLPDAADTLNQSETQRAIELINAIDSIKFGLEDEEFEELEVIIGDGTLDNYFALKEKISYGWLLVTKKVHGITDEDMSQTQVSFSVEKLGDASFGTQVFTLSGEGSAEAMTFSAGTQPGEIGTATYKLPVGGYHISEVDAPMMIDGVMVDTAYATYNGQIGDGIEVQIQPGTITSVLAVNNRRSSLELTTAVDNPEAALDGDKYTYTITATEANGAEIWFSASDEGEDIKDLDTTATHEGGDSGYYYVESGKSFVVTMKAGWTLRFNNLPIGSKIDIEQTACPPTSTFSIEASERINSQENFAEINSKTATATVTIQSNNCQYVVTYNHERHHHELTYELKDEATIKAICQNTDCPEPDAGSITLLAPTNLVYDGEAKLAEISGGIEGMSDMSIVYTKDGNALNETPVNAGNYTASITLGGETASVNYTIEPASIEGAVVSADDQTYTGQALTPEVTVKWNEALLDKRDNYDVTFSNNINVADKPVITVTGKGNYKGAATGTFNILAKVVANPTIELSREEYVYDGQAKEPAVTVKDGDTVIPPQEYTTQYIDNVSVGTLTNPPMVIIFDGEGGNYTVYGSKAFVIKKSDSAINEVKTYLNDKENTEFTYGQTVTVTGRVQATGTAADTGTTQRKIVVSPNQAVLYDETGTTELAGPVDLDSNGGFELTYDTTSKKIKPADSVTMLVRFTGDSNMEEQVLAFSIKLNKAPLTPVLGGTVTKVYDGTKVVPEGHELFVDVSGRIGSDVFVVGDTKYAYQDAKVGENKIVTASGFALDEPEAEFYTLTADTISGENGIITKAKLTDVAAPADQTLTDYCEDAAAVFEKLPGTVVCTTETGDTDDIAISWSCADYDSTPSKENTFHWQLDDHEKLECYDPSGVKVSGSILVTNAEALPVNLTGTDRGIAYDGHAFDVSSLFAIDQNAGMAGYELMAGGTGEGTLEGTQLTVARVGTFYLKLTTAANGKYAEAAAQAVLTVEKGTPVTQEDVPAGLTAWYSQALRDVELNAIAHPLGAWVWVDPDALVGEVQPEANKHPVRFIPNEAAAPLWNEVDGLNATVTVVKAATAIIAVAEKELYIYGNDLTIRVTVNTAAPQRNGFALFARRTAAGSVKLLRDGLTIAEKAAGNGDTVEFTLNTVEEGYLPGRHTLLAQYEETDNMAAQTAEISFTVAYAETSEEADISGDRNEEGWRRADPTLTAPEGSKISLGFGPEAEWSDSLTLPTEDGEHPYTYYVKDESGLISEKTVTVMMDKSAPVVGEIDIQVGTNGAEITAPATDEHSGILDCRITVNSGKGDLEISGKGDGRYTIAGMIPGETYDFTLTVMDRVGHTTAVSFTVTAAQLPQTGDESQLGLWLMLMGMACAGMLTLRRKAHN